MFKKLFLIILSTALPFAAVSQSFTISGNAKTYAGDTLKLYVIDDYITNSESLIATAAVDKNGNFSFTGRVSEIMPAYIDLTVFNGRIFLQPNVKEEIVLPEKQQITLEDKLNPYFKKTEFYVKTVNSGKEDLNTLIPEFEKYFNSAMAKVFYNTRGVSKAATDSMENAVREKFTAKNQFFLDYQKYRFALLDYSAYHRNKNDIVSELFTGKQPLMNNPAYAELFDEFFSNVFTSGKTSAIMVKDLYQGVYDKSYNTLKQKMLAEPRVGDEKFADYLILKGLKDAYYAGNFPKENLVAVADSMTSALKDKQFKKIAATLSKKFTTLLCGFPPPQIILKDVNGEEYYLEKSSGKFVYLTFYNPNSYTANADLELLKQIYKEVPPEMMEIVTVFVSQNKDDMKKFLDSDKEIKWKFLWYGFDNQLLKNYDVRAYPVYYLVNPDGNLVMNPAPSPQEDFPSKFSALYRNWKNDQYRKQHRENQGIK